MLMWKFKSIISFTSLFKGINVIVIHTPKYRTLPPTIIALHVNALNVVKHSQQNKDAHAQSLYNLYQVSYVQIWENDQKELFVCKS